MMKIDTYSNNEHKQDFMHRFSRLPRELYPERPLPSDEYWPYLISQFAEVDAEFFILNVNGKDVGRIGCNLSNAFERTGFFGFFEIDLAHGKSASELIAAAQMWLKNKKVETLIGPIDLNVWMNNRFKVKGHENNFSWEPNGPREYARFFEECGYHYAQEYISMIYNDNTLSYERTKSAYEKALSKGFRFRNLDFSDANEADTLYRLNISAFPTNYMYEPISKEQYKALHIKAASTEQMRYSFMAISPDGEEMGYVYSFADRSYLVVKTMLILPEFQGERLASALLHATFKQGRSDGLFRSIGAMIRKGNVSQHFFDHLQAPNAKNEYVILKKKL